MRAFLLSLILFVAAPAAHASEGGCERLLVKTKTAVKQIFERIFRKTFPAVPDVKSEFNDTEREYKANNKATDTKPSQEDAVITYTFNRPEVTYFSTRRYVKVNSATGVMMIDGGGGLPLKQMAVDPSAEVLTVHVDKLVFQEGMLNVPVGYRAVGYSGKGLYLEVRPAGVVFRKIGREDVQVQLAPDTAQQLKSGEVDQYLRVDQAPALNEYPARWAEFLQELLNEREETKITNLQVAKKLSSFIRKTLKYEVDATSTLGVLDFCQHGAAQCDGSTLVFVTILRSIFKIPALPVGGVRSVKFKPDPSLSVLHDQLTPHMFALVYDDVANKFEVIDPTSSNKTREKKNQGKDDDRFEDQDPDQDEDDSDQEDKEADHDVGPQSKNLKKSKPKMPNSSLREGQNELDEKAAITATVDALWKRLFASAKSISWIAVLQKIEDELEQGSKSSRLTPDQEIALQNVRYMNRIVKVLPAASLPTMLNSLGASSKEVVAELKNNYLRLQLFARLSVYGVIHSQQPKSYRRIAEVCLQILAHLAASTPLDSDKELSDGLPGPFSREALKLSPGKIPLLKQLARLNEKVHLLKLQNFILHPSVVYHNSFSQTDYDDDFITAEDFDHMANFERGGLPPEYDAIRVLNDDMLVRVWKDPITVRHEELPVEVDGLEVNYILIDLSGSMVIDGRFRGLIRDRLVQMSIDKTKARNPQARILLIPYRDFPESPINLDAYADSRQLFHSMLTEEEFFKSDRGNNAGLAFQAAVQHAIGLKSKIARINFELITDGDESMDIDLFRKAKDELGVDLQINLTAVTLGVGNVAMERFIKNSRGTNLMRDQVYIHLSEADLINIVDSSRDLRDQALDQLLPANFRDVQFSLQTRSSELKKLGKDLESDTPR